MHRTGLSVFDSIIQSPTHSSQVQAFDVNDLKANTTERNPILIYHLNLHDEIRNTYIIIGPCQPRTH